MTPLILRIVGFVILGGVSVYDLIASFFERDMYNTVICLILGLILGVVAFFSFWRC